MNYNIASTMEHHISIYNRIPEKVTPYKDTLIICLETAADFIGLYDGSIFETDIIAYSTINQEIHGFILKILPDCFETKKYVEKQGIYCTTPEQTLLDLLEYEDDVDIQTLLESLSFYYYTHNETFNNLEAQMNKIQIQSFNKWKQDAIDYYNED